MSRDRGPAPPAGEDRLIAWLRRRLPGGLIGDDAAVLPRQAWAVTTDAQIAGVHLPADLDPAWAARRLLAVNLSDLAAMGAVPAYAFLALAAPADYDHRRFLDALHRAAARHGIELAGGDLARQPHLTAVLTLLGRRSRGGRWLRRGGARPGDGLWLGGTVGEAALGLELLGRGARLAGRTIHLPPGLRLSDRLARAARRAVRRQLAPSPQLALGRWLAGETRRGGAIDLSDGLARDLYRLCRESDAGAVVRSERLPLARDAVELAARLDREPYEMALFGGEDYVLLFSLPADVVPPAAFGCRRIGEIQGGRRVELIEDGARRRLPDRGWDHLDGEQNG
ncbi:MAG: thiamine-phosphate kinase [Acidobacteria bacterium]|nr:MAG: thiamine-phosphate kinase [Acidobacteriota bacterium]